MGLENLGPSRESKETPAYGKLNYFPEVVFTDNGVRVCAAIPSSEKSISGFTKDFVKNTLNGNTIYSSTLKELKNRTSLRKPISKEYLEEELKGLEAEWHEENQSIVYTSFTGEDFKFALKHECAWIGTEGEKTKAVVVETDEIRSYSTLAFALEHMLLHQRYSLFRLSTSQKAFWRNSTFMWADIQSTGFFYISLGLGGEKISCAFDALYKDQAKTKTCINELSSHVRRVAEVIDSYNWYGQPKARPSVSAKVKFINKRGVKLALPTFCVKDPLDSLYEVAITKEDVWLREGQVFYARIYPGGIPRQREASLLTIFTTSFANILHSIVQAS